MLAGSAVFIVLLLAITGVKHTGSFSSSYHSITSNYHLPSWRPHLPHLPSIIHTPSRPSNTTLDLENGDLKHPPSQLKKSSANFHLVMPAREDDPTFCRTTLSAMILNLPPPTTINLYKSFKSDFEKDRAILKGMVQHLKSSKLVKDEDLVLFVDAHDTWFQLPSEVIIRQYQNVLADANERLLDAYGRTNDGYQKYNQTIVFGAAKVCEGDDLSCKYAPESLLPPDIYGQKTGQEMHLTPAKYLDATMVIGPAKDLRTLYEAAVANLDGRHSQAGTMQSVLAAIFGEQEIARGPGKKTVVETAPKPKPAPSRWLNWFGGPVSKTEEKEENQNQPNITVRADQQFEFSIGLDYAHILFQPLVHATSAELVPLPHDNSTDLTNYHHFDTPTPLLTIPSALQQAHPPFWTPDLSKKNPRPKNVKPAAIDALQLQEHLDDLRPRDTPWASLDLVQNTYTGAIPVLLSLRRDQSPHPTFPELNWNSLWYSNHSRAMLRRYLRQTQSPIGFHNAAVGGDSMWDQRGGRGGVWTVEEGLWLPWGEVDGVCGTLEQVTKVFDDGKGVWLHENEEDAEKKRLEAEDELKKKIEEQKKKEEEQKKKQEEEKEKERQKESNKEVGGDGVVGFGGALSPLGDESPPGGSR